MAEPFPSLAHRLANDLIDIGAVTFSPDDPYTWASGIKSPIYCDNRLTMAYPRIRSLIAEGFAERIETLALDPVVIVGTATAGIPHAAWLAGHMGLPMAYVRSKPKQHGRGNQIEGIVEAGQRVVVIEDLISTGGSSAKTVNVLRDRGADVAAVLAIFSYGLPLSTNTFTAIQVPFDTLTNFPVMVEVAQQKGYLDTRTVDILENWRSMIIK